MPDLSVRLAAVAVGLAVVCAAPAAEKKPAPDPTPKTVVYEVADLLHRPGGFSGYDSVDEISRAVLDATGPEHWAANKKDAWTLRELDGVKLEVTAPAAAHEEVRNVLRALRSVQDVAVVVHSDLIEVDAAYYDKTLRPLLAGARRAPDGPAAVAVSEELAAAIRKKGTVVRSTRSTLAIGHEGTCLSLRQVFSYLRVPGDPKVMRSDEYAVAATGTSFRATATTSPDRRFVRLKLTEQTTDLLGFDKKPGFRGTAERPQEVEVTTPDLSETTASLTLHEGDGAMMLVTVQHMPKATKDRGRVLVLLAQPRIYIEEEEKARGNNPGK